MGKWIKCESEFLSEALIHSMLSCGPECSGKLPLTWKGAKVHSLIQVNKSVMEICWECSDGFGGVKMGNCKVDMEWWRD